MPENNNDISPLINKLNLIQPLSTGLQEALTQSFKKLHLKPGRMLITQGIVCDHMYFLSAGTLCSWVNLPGEDENETITRIMRPGQIVVSPVSFYDTVPTIENIQVLEDAILFRIHRDELNEIYKKFPEFNHNIRILTERYLCQVAKRELLMRHRDVEARYNYCIQQFSHLVMYINEKLAASFASMNRTTFNKLKNGTYTKKRRKNL